jgi:hypothetical protein
MAEEDDLGITDRRRASEGREEVELLSLSAVDEGLGITRLWGGVPEGVDVAGGAGLVREVRISERMGWRRSNGLGEL